MTNKESPCGPCGQQQPLQQLCTIIKAISDGQEHNNKATVALALGILMKVKKEEAGDLLAQHLDSDFSCFLCRKKCRTKARFFLHFKRHLKKQEFSDSDSDSEESKNCLKKRPRKIVQQPLQPRDDNDSGCHSNGELTSDCPGDSEDSETEEKPEDYDLKLSLAEKQLDNNETESLVCLTCLKRFSNCQNLRRHLRLHIARDSIKPDFTEDSSSVDDGVEAASKGRFLCDWCPARFDNRSAFRIHEESHRGQEPKCYVCNKQYADRYSLRYHLRTHGIGRQIRCEYCSKAFSKPSRLAAHIRSHHKNIRDFACPSCDKTFKTRVHLKNHFRQHSGEKPYECGVCHEKFRHKASMISHCRKHDGQRPYCCEICGKTFREPSTLKAHSRVHTGDKPYTCSECGKCFTQRAGLNYHKRASHENFRPFACKICPFATVKSASLNAHYRNIHHTENQAEVVKLPSFDNLKTTTSPRDDESNSNSPTPFLQQHTEENYNNLMPENTIDYYNDYNYATHHRSYDQMQPQQMHQQQTWFSYQQQQQSYNENNFYFGAASGGNGGYQFGNYDAAYSAALHQAASSAQHHPSYCI